ncbi:unnamed protein product [Closterium sp. Naga37s-1]|nr:unnamed protein product [Closterium sp. Naga37s-1]
MRLHPSKGGAASLRVGATRAVLSSRVPVPKNLRPRPPPLVALFTSPAFFRLLVVLLALSFITLTGLSFVEIEEDTVEKAITRQLMSADEDDKGGKGSSNDLGVHLARDEEELPEQLKQRSRQSDGGETAEAGEAGGAGGGEGEEESGGDSGDQSDSLHVHVHLIASCDVESVEESLDMLQSKVLWDEHYVPLTVLLDCHDPKYESAIMLATRRVQWRFGPYTVRSNAPTIETATARTAAAAGLRGGKGAAAAGAGAAGAAAGGGDGEESDWAVVFPRDKVKAAIFQSRRLLGSAAAAATAGAARGGSSELAALTFLDAWRPKSALGIAFYLQDSARVSPFFYRFLVDSVEMLAGAAPPSDDGGDSVGELYSSPPFSTLFGINILDPGTAPVPQQPPPVWHLHQALTIDCQFVFPTPWEEILLWRRSFPNTSFTLSSAVSHLKDAAFAISAVAASREGSVNLQGKFQGRGRADLGTDYFTKTCQADPVQQIHSLLDSHGRFNLLAPDINGSSMCVSLAPIRKQEERAKGLVAAAAKAKRKLNPKEAAEVAKAKKAKEVLLARLFDDPQYALGKESPRVVRALEKSAVSADALLRTPRTDMCGRPVRRGLYAQDVKGLRKMLSVIQTNNTVVAVMTSVGFADMLTNWLCYVRELGFTNFFIITTSAKQALDLFAKGHAVFLLRPSFIHLNSSLSSSSSSAAAAAAAAAAEAAHLRAAAYLQSAGGDGQQQGSQQGQRGGRVGRTLLGLEGTRAEEGGLVVTFESTQKSPRYNGTRTLLGLEGTRAEEGNLVVDWREGRHGNRLLMSAGGSGGDGFGGVGGGGDGGGGEGGRRKAKWGFRLVAAAKVMKRAARRVATASGLRRTPNITVPFSMEYGGIGYKQLLLKRTRLVGSILKMGYNVLLADVDAVWLSDPFVHMGNKSVDIYGQLEPSGQLCGGFLFLRSTPRVVTLWDQVTGLYTRTFNRMAKEALYKKPEEMGAWLKQFEHLHEQRYLNQLLGKRRSKVQDWARSRSPTATSGAVGLGGTTGCGPVGLDALNSRSPAATSGAVGLGGTTGCGPVGLDALNSRSPAATSGAVGLGGTTGCGPVGLDALNSRSPAATSGAVGLGGTTGCGPVGLDALNSRSPAATSGAVGLGGTTGCGPVGLDALNSRSPAATSGAVGLGGTTGCGPVGLDALNSRSPAATSGAVGLGGTTGCGPVGLDALNSRSPTAPQQCIPRFPVLAPQPNPSAIGASALHEQTFESTQKSSALHEQRKRRSKVQVPVADMLSVLLPSTPLPLPPQQFEHLHEQRYLNQLLGKRRNKVQVRGLDVLKFPNGKEFFVQRAPQQAEVAPVVIHNNYIKGKKVRVTVGHVTVGHVTVGHVTVAHASVAGTVCVR